MLTAPLLCIRAPFISPLDLCLFTSCELPNVWSAERFSPDILRIRAALSVQMIVRVAFGLVPIGDVVVIGLVGELPQKILTFTQASRP